MDRHDLEPLQLDLCGGHLRAHFHLKVLARVGKGKEPMTVPRSCSRAPVGYKINANAACLQPNGRRWGHETCRELKIQH